MTIHRLSTDGRILTRAAAMGSSTLLTVLLVGSVLPGSARSPQPGEFFTQRGEDPSFEEVMNSGDLPRGKDSSKGFEGSTIKVNDKLLDSGPNADRSIARDIRIHTLGNSFIRRDSFSNWSRWYQEDRNTQIFRLFKGEENVRNSREKAARVEAYSTLSWSRGKWHEWVGTYTVIRPPCGAIFQAKNDADDWAVQLNVGANGDLLLNHRRAKDQVIARDVIGRPFHIRVRDNGHDYEVYLNGEMKGSGVYPRPRGKTNFRWGMYFGANDVPTDAMIFVTGAGIDPKGYDPLLARTDSEASPAPTGKVHIPERTWTNSLGETIRAPATYDPDNQSFHLLIKGKQRSYSLKLLSEKDREFLKGASKLESGRSGDLPDRFQGLDD